MEKENVQKIILNAVKTTEPTWSNWYVHWEDIEEVFLSRAFDIGGFDNWLFINDLKKHNLNIKKIGSILDKTKIERKYKRDFAGNLNSPFYKDLQNGKYGEAGEQFYQSITEFTGNLGGFLWMQLWRILVCCNYLENNYDGSFAVYLKKRYAEYKNIETISDSDFLLITVEEWQNFIKNKQPWNELYGIGPNVFDYVIRDIVELEFVKNSFKLDAANIRFFTKTGIFKSEELNQENVITFLKDLNLPYSLGDINKGVYAYCSKLHCGTYCFCRDPKRCQDCHVEEICEQNF